MPGGPSSKSLASSRRSAAAADGAAMFYTPTTPCRPRPRGPHASGRTTRAGFPRRSHGRSAARTMFVRWPGSYVRDDVRLLTLTGPGRRKDATGARRGARPRRRVRRRRDVRLAGLDRAAGAPRWGAGRRSGPLSAPGESPEDAVKRFLGPKHALVVLDNFEHLLSAAPMVTELLAHCRALTVLATSREPLQSRARAPLRGVALAGAGGFSSERGRRRPPRARCSSSARDSTVPRSR